MAPDLSTASRPPWLTLTGVRISLGVKISAILALGVTLAGVSTTIVASTQMRIALMQEFRSKGEGISRGLATVIVPLIVRADQAKITASADEFSKTAGVAYVLVNDPSAQVIAAAMHVHADVAEPGAHEFSPSLVAAITHKEELRADAEIASVEVDVPNLGRFLDISYPIMSGGLGRAHVGLDLEAIESRVASLRNGILLQLLCLICLSMAASTLFSRFLMRPLLAMVRVLRQVSTGDLQARAVVDTRDEFSMIGDTVNQMISSLRDIVSSVRQATVQVNDASEEILATARKQERAVGEQVSGLEEISQTMNALTSTARAIAENTHGVTRDSQTMSEEVKLGQIALNASKDSVAHIVEQNTIIVDRIHRLYEQSESIVAIIDIIDNISDRLDLLALNAALEGARAGEVGKGFSLVAAEMRRLAENVSESTQEIKSTIQKIHALVRVALEASQTGTDRTQVGSVEMQKTFDIMSKIFGLIDKTAASTQEITVITQQQLASSQHISKAMREMASIATEGVVASRDVSRRAADLAGMSSTLQSQVSVFQMDTKGWRGSDGKP